MLAPVNSAAIEGEQPMRTISSIQTAVLAVTAYRPRGESPPWFGLDDVVVVQKRSLKPVRMAAVVDDRGLPPGGSDAEGRRGLIDDGGLPPGGSAAEGRRGLIDDRGLPPGGSAAEGRRGLIDDRGLPPGGSAAEGRRGLIERLAAALRVHDHRAIRPQPR